MTAARAVDVALSATYAAWAGMAKAATSATASTAPVTVAVRERFVNDFMESCFDGLNDCPADLDASSADFDGARAAPFNRVR